MVTIQDIVASVFEQLPHGRIASWPSVAEYMMSHVLKAGTQPHLEIGVLHGGTLIMAAMVKKLMVGKGMVIGIDPLDGYYPANALHVGGVRTDANCLITRKKVDRWDDTPISRETVDANIKAFDVGDYIQIVQEFSYPWPTVVGSTVFGTIYIDGDHYQEGPLVDWVNVQRNSVRGTVVMFDDCNHNCPGVQRAAHVARHTPGWEFVEHHQGHCFVVRKK